MSEKHLEQLETNGTGWSSIDILPIELKLALSKIKEQNKCYKVLKNMIANLKTLREELISHEGQPIEFEIS